MKEKKMENYLQDKDPNAQTIDFHDETIAPLLYAYNMSLAVAQLARDQLMLEHDQEKEILSYMLLPPTAQPDSMSIPTLVPSPQGNVIAAAVISQDQIKDIRSCVSTLYSTLERKGTTHKNYYRYIFEDLYHSYGITSYRLIPQSLFDEIIVFLTDWHTSLLQDDNPQE